MLPAGLKIDPNQIVDSMSLNHLPKLTSDCQNAGVCQFGNVAGRMKSDSKSAGGYGDASVGGYGFYGAEADAAPFSICTPLQGSGALQHVPELGCRASTWIPPPPPPPPPPIPVLRSCCT